ncbi:MAG: polysaccharide pyruvyl transferase family protein [Alphaproteobacteria bacterium]|nr:polysaccharide pyruvyl transferase family protein [Alphaproteobacteria bacterium]MBQ9234939.1 polysaccharide pyruvyl transferase family protein [Alphaproteobacteria bacterium]
MSKYLITGGGFGNKGAESMVYTAISKIRAVEPEAEITVVCFVDFTNIDKANFDRIKIVTASLKTRKRLNSRLKTCFDLLKRRKQTVQLYQELKSCDCVIDVSGFALSSYWSKTTNLKLLTTINMAKRFGKKVILMPQSFGPFDYKEKMNRLVISTLKKCDLIFAREKEGFELLAQQGLTNVALSADMVLQMNTPYDHIWKSLKPFTVAQNKAVMGGG